MNQKSLRKIWNCQKETIIDESHVRSNENWVNTTEKSIKGKGCRITEFTQNEMGKREIR